MALKAAAPPPSAAWAGTKAWGGRVDAAFNDDDEPLVRRDKYGRKIEEKPAAPIAPAASSTGRPAETNVAGHKDLIKRVVKVGDGSRGAPPPRPRILSTLSGT